MKHATAMEQLYDQSFKWPLKKCKSNLTCIFSLQHSGDWKKHDGVGEEKADAEEELDEQSEVDPARRLFGRQVESYDVPGLRTERQVSACPKTAKKQCFSQLENIIVMLWPYLM